MKKNKGFSLTEIMIAVVVSSLLIGGLLYFSVGNSVTMTKTVVYYQALQLAHETIAWIRTIPPSAINDNIGASITDSITDSSNIKTIKLPTSSVGIDPQATLEYPESYAKSWFHRKVSFERLTGDKGRYLIKATVTIGWNEGKPPSNPSLDKREKQLVLTTTIFDESESY